MVAILYQRIQYLHLLLQVDLLERVELIFLWVAILVQFQAKHLDLMCYHWKMNHSKNQRLEEVLQLAGLQHQKFESPESLLEFVDQVQQEWVLLLEHQLNLKPGSGHYYLDLLEGLLGLEECQQLEWDQVLEWVREFLRQEQDRE